MTKKFKKIFFLGICLFFLIATPTVILYSQGYRFDFQNRKIVQTGGFFFKISPPGVTIDLDQKALKTTNFFFSNAFLSGLMPKNYQVTVKKDGYHPWNKILKIEEKQVTEAKNIVLFPKNPTFNLLTKNIKDFSPSPDGKQIILKTEDKEKRWVIILLNIQTQKQIELVSERELLSLEKNKKINKISFLDLLWSDDSKKALLKIGVEGGWQYLVVDITQRNSPFFINLGNGLKNVSFNPNNSEEIFFIDSSIDQSTSSKDLIENKNPAKKTIFRLKINGEQSMINLPTSLFNQEIISYSLLNDNVFWLTDAGFLYQGRLNGNKIDLLQSLNLKPLIINKEANYKIMAKSVSKILLKENNALYRLNPKSHLFEKIFGSVKSVKFSSNQRAIAVKTDNQLQVFYLDEEHEQPQRKIGDRVFLAGFNKEINDFFWLNDFYVIFQIDGSIKVAETDNRSKVNLIELTTFSQPKIFWNQETKTLFVLSNGNLYSCSNILK